MLTKYHLFEEVINQRKKEHLYKKKGFKFYSIEIQVVALESGRTLLKKKKKEN